jgi:hypothetical protein
MASATNSSGAARVPSSSRSSIFVRKPHPHGVRRRREDSAAVEIEELDSRTMRQNSYNFFQQAQPSLLRTSTFHSSLGRSPTSRKRQRTLAEQLDDLCLQSSRGRVAGVDKSGRGRSRSQRRARDKNRADASRIVELDEFEREKVPSIDGSGSDSDGMIDVGEQAGLKVYGDAAGMPGLRSFFAAGAAGHHQPMDKMYRHYVAVAAQSAASTAPQGNEMVVFRPPAPVITAFTEDLPAYLSLTPHEFEKLSMAEKRQWYQAHSRYMRELDQTAAEQKNDSETGTRLEAKPTGELQKLRRRSSSASSSRSYQLLGVPSTDEEDDGGLDDFGEDVEMMEDVEEEAAPKRPHAAGALTHTEWFMDDEL